MTYREPAARIVSTIEERTTVLAGRTDRLELLSERFMAQTAASLHSIDQTIKEMKAEGARDRAQAAGDRKEMNRRWGDLANKMGTVVQDIVAPSLRRMAREELGCGEERSFSAPMFRTRSDDPHYRREFDALYVGTQAVLLNETKSTALSEYASAFVRFLKSDQFALYFPEYGELPLVPVFSSLSLPDDLITYLTRNGIHAVAMGEDTMQVLNLDVVRGKQRNPSDAGP